MGFPGRLRGFGRCCAALLAWLLGLVALPAIGPELPSTDDQVVAPVPAVNDELPAQRLVVLIAHRPQGPPAVLEAAAASSFSQLPAGALRARGLVVVCEIAYVYDGTRVPIRGYVGTSDPVNRWDPSGLDWVWVSPPGEWRWVPGEGEIDYNELPGFDPPEWSRPVFNGRRNGQRIATANAIAGRFQDFGLSRGTMVLAEGVGQGTIAHWPAEVAANISGFVNRNEGITTLDGALTAFNAEIDRIAAEIRRQNEEAAIPRVRFATERVDDVGRLVVNEAHATLLDTLFMDGDAVRGEFVGGDLPQEDIEALRTAAVILTIATPVGMKNQAQRQGRRFIRGQMDETVESADEAVDATISASTRGHPTAVLHGFASLSRRQENLLGNLPSFGSSSIVRKGDVDIKDLTALTASTGDEFLMLTRGPQRMIVRGDARGFSGVVDPEWARKMAENQWRLSGHTHPAVAGRATREVLGSSEGDRIILEAFGQSRSMIRTPQGPGVNVFTPLGDP